MTARPASHICGGLYVSGYEAVESWCESHPLCFVASFANVAAARVPKGYPHHVHLYFQDDIGGMAKSEKNLASLAGTFVAKALSHGYDVLCCCGEGRNRACLVAALALVRTTRFTAESALEAVRTRREPDLGSLPLTNPHFLHFLSEQ